MAKLREILKDIGMFSKDIKQKVSNGNIQINGVVTKEIDLEVDVPEDFEHIEIGTALFEAISLSEEHKKEADALIKSGVEFDCLLPI